MDNGFRIKQPMMNSAINNKKEVDIEIKEVDIDTLFIPESYLMITLKRSEFEIMVQNYKVLYPEMEAMLMFRQDGHSYFIDFENDVVYCISEIDKRYSDGKF